MKQTAALKAGVAKGRNEGQYSAMQQAAWGNHGGNTWNYNLGNKTTADGGAETADLSSACGERELVREVAFQRHHFSPLISLH